MKCNDIRDHLLDLIGQEPGPGELRDHLRACAACAAELDSMRRTMALLDQWQAPADTSPYFLTRLRARLHEEWKPALGLMKWFRRPALAVSMTVLMLASISLFQGSWHLKDNPNSHGPVAMVPGTAVGDLQYLDRNHELLADFELLDDLVNVQHN
jgi:predicted anti-sigma-YlaC factor YlaD